ncbi:hypothetical protein [Rufibacter sp. XAAS-G3-1]|uniref:hypothetical protein n=1 Tax=Rufibacter sp. XAAS-G3-1 TaxID=2729134 RepID=UPI0015E6A10D|nr:hypothetical protein [Rufibacter sp. XAAS-G3-1]
MALHLSNQKGNSILIHRLLWVLAFLLLQPGKARAQPSDATITVAAGKHYLKSAWHRFWWGRHYRPVWAEPVEVPYFWVSQFKGGVTPLKEGGSFQTKNLRLVDAAGREYVLRSIDKDPTKALPSKLRKTFVANLMRDQTSVIHPYGAFLVPTLASAAGVYHTNPRLVYIADDPALGEFREEFAQMLALLEERPDGNWENLRSFGNPKSIVSSRKAFENLIGNPAHQVDAKRYLLSRLFDMWLSDWSRREDQWRWAVAEKGARTQYEPIPRDRDHAFFKFNDGLLTKLVSVFKLNYQSFDKTIVGKNVKGLIKSSSQMDGHLLAYLTKRDFDQAARELQQKLSDQVIAEALQEWPTQIRELSAREFTAKLRSRREDLPAASAAFYKLINKEVLLPGTEAKDRFVVQFEEDGRVVVQHWAAAQDATEILLHQKSFSPSETTSLAIYGLGGEDTFVLAGKGRNKIKLRLYGGEGTDQLTVQPSFQLTGKKINLLDEEDGNEYEKNDMIKREEYTPAAQEFNGAGWLLRHRLH